MPVTHSHRLVKVTLHIIFFLSGITTVLIGQVLPIFARHFSLNDLQVSYFFPAQFAGSLAGTYLTSLFGRKNDFLTASILGGVLMAGGVLLMNVEIFSVCLVGFLINGLGVGMTLPSINILILELNTDRPGPALSILNFCWGLGAIVSKPFVDLFSTVDSIGVTTFVLAIPLLAGSFLLFVAAGKKVDPSALSSHTDESEVIPIWTTPIAWMIALFNFVHVGFESGIGGWLTTYAGRLDGQPILHWISPTLLYFSFFVIGRGVAPVLFRFLNENKMLVLGLLIVFAGMIVTLSAGSVVALSLGATIAGFGTSWIFPTNVARFSRTFGPTATRRATPLFICGTLGAASSTWLIGFISDKTGNLHSGMVVLIIAVLLLIFLQIGLGLRGVVAAK
ncbi:MAG TPA: MFS transporter [Pyrinomonadaceae bacterium]|nr:MFS transporter [Pyrinomonadaceae bacterium]